MTLSRSGAIALLVTIGITLLLAVTTSISTTTALRVGGTAAVAIIVVQLVTHARADDEPEPSDFDRAAALGAPEEPARPRWLVTFERLATAHSAGDLHYRLRPALRELAVHRLAAIGIALDDEPDAARARLGAELHDLVRADRLAPEDRLQPGFTTAQLADAATRLEAL